MKKFKKAISIILCLALILSLFVSLGGVAASAANEAAGKRDLDWDGIWWYSDTKTTVPYSSGSGTADDPYIVTTAAQLRLLAKGNASGGGKYYKLGNDIVLNDTSSEDWYEKDGLTNWIKGSDAEYGVFSDTRNGRELSENLFRDTFDGNGYTISGLYINYEGTGQIDQSTTGLNRLAVGWALFPSVQGATIKNLKLKDVYIKSNVSVTCGSQPHGYGALIGYSYGSGATVSNVQIENVKFDIQSPNQAKTNYFVGVGSLIGYVTGPFTATDCIVKNISGKAGNNYFNTNYKNGSAGGLIGFVAGDISGSKYTFKNIISIGRMNPLYVGAADPAFTFTTANFSSGMPIRAGSTATNVYAIGDVSILANSNITKAVDEAAFVSTYLDTFYNNIGGSTNWAPKEAGKLPELADFVDVSECEHETTKDAIIEEATYFKAGLKNVVCADEACGAMVETDVVIPAAEAALNGDFTETFADGKLTISWTYSDALALDIANGAVITFNYEIAGYENAVVLDGETGASVTLEGFNADRLNADLTYNLSAVYGDVDTAKLNAVGGTVKTADIANDEKLDALLEALEADAVVNGTVANSEWLVSNTAKLDLKAATAELRITASQKLIDTLATLGKDGRTVTLTVKVGDITKTFTLEKLYKVTIINVSGLSFEQLNGEMSAQLNIDYEGTDNDILTDEIVFACGDMIANADTAAADAFAAYMN